MNANAPLAARQLLAEAFSLPMDQVPGDAALDNFEPWDSLGHVQVLTALETALARPLEAEEAIAIIDIETLGAALNGATRCGS